MREQITKPANVVMLHSDKPSMLWVTSMGILMKTLNNSNIKSLTNQHLYFTTNDTIEEADCYIDDTNTIRKSVTSDRDYWERRGDYKKIVATTNPELWIKNENKPKLGSYVSFSLGNQLPKIDTSFVEAYVREQGKIDQVLLEYEQPTKGYFAGIELYDSMIEVLKLKSNGSVIVHRVKEKTYTSDEVETLLHNMYKDCTTPEAYDKSHFDYWIKNNLP